MGEQRVEREQATEGMPEQRATSAVDRHHSLHLRCNLLMDDLQQVISAGVQRRGTRRQSRNLFSPFWVDGRYQLIHAPLHEYVEILLRLGVTDADHHGRFKLLGHRAHPRGERPGAEVAIAVRDIDDGESTRRRLRQRQRNLYPVVSAVDCRAEINLTTTRYGCRLQRWDGNSRPAFDDRRRGLHHTDHRDTQQQRHHCSHFSHTRPLSKKTEQRVKTHCSASIHLPESLKTSRRTEHRRSGVK